MRKFLVILMVVLLAVLALSKTKIVFWTMSLKPTFTDFIQGIIDRYEELNPDVEIVWEDVPWDVLQQKLLAAFSSGNPPDVVNLNAQWTIEFAQKKVLFPLNDLLPEEVINQYFDNMIKGLTWKDGIYGIPWYTAVDVIFYNKEIFEKAGLDPKYPPRTWDEILLYSVLIKEKTGKYGALPTIFQDPSAIFNWDGLNLYTVDENNRIKEVLFDRPEYAHTLNKWATLYKQKYIPSEIVQGGEWTRATELYQAGELAMLITGVQFADRVKWNAPEIYEKSDVAPIPAPKPGVRMSGWYSTLNVVRGSKNPKEAAKFAAFVANLENQIAFCKLVTIFPTLKAAVNDPWFSKDDGTLAAKARIMGAKYLENITFYNDDIPFRKEAFDRLKDAIIQVFLGQKDPETALKETAKYWRYLIQTQQSK
ncbi:MULTISPECIES: ABC transporter substrate-binding protein [Thermotoga]|jgi:putative chitobiose transport system substrate-binding protein|uniref:Sugar ABC transporter, periplasmic sugar-binding protein n=4 Tax=Thermotoga TaxID=2335 RepID=Q9WZR7_THEMA|nr:MULTISPECIES: sugar ABC transporter substrate-binding protein [Thermotoga]KUK23221.1 MAG: Extracellular solute-binding protein, family 1 [Thermotoga petrophila]KUK33864.1 MAG: Extracellular solute-binding protein, family 1 [Thermotoga sp. 47_83]MBZ4660985.1 extracellular solute-binding protein family 1 [Thermotoga sp.]AAD35892.1 sugar ABC transporter, periplasmic sugar-binding protein [Thermotoga maritima MSB8]ABQ46147.1 extracellular solute-binding protein, family 1 [Thermotoga petrophila 